MEKVIINAFSAYIKNNIKYVFYDEKIWSECFNEIPNITSVIKNVLVIFKTEYKRFNFFAEKRTYIK